MHVPAELAGSVGTVALFGVPGYCLTELFGVLRRLPWPRRAAFGYLLGVVAVAGGLYLLSHAFAVPLRAPAVWACAVVPALVGLAVGVARRWRRRERRDRAATMEPSGLAVLEPSAEALSARMPAPPDRPRSPATGPAATGAGMAPGSPAERPRPAGGVILGALRSPGAWTRSLGGPLPAAAVVLAALVCVGVLAEAASNPIHDWDGRMTWSAQARYLRGAGTVDAEALQNPRWYISHPQYPPLLPVAQVAALEAFAAGPDSHLQRALYAAFLPVLLLLVYDGARRAAGRGAAALVVLAAAAIPFFAYGEGGAFSTYSDLPLACFYGAALLLLLGPRPALGGGAAAGLLLAGAVLSKNEGVLLAVLALALGWRRGGRLAPAARAAEEGGGAGSARFRPAAEDGEGGGAGAASPRPTAPTGGRAPRPRREALLRYAAAAVPVALALALLASWRHGIPNREDEDYPLLIQTTRLWPDVLVRTSVFAPIMLRQMFRFHHWAGFWWMAPVVLIAGREALRHPHNRRLLAAAAGPLAIGWAACSIYPNPYFLASVTWERMLLQGSVPIMIVLAAALDRVLRRLRMRGSLAARTA